MPRSRRTSGTTHPPSLAMFPRWNAPPPFGIPPPWDAHLGVPTSHRLPPPTQWTPRPHRSRHGSRKECQPTRPCSHRCPPQGSLRSGLCRCGCVRSARCALDSGRVYGVALHELARVHHVTPDPPPLGHHTHGTTKTHRPHFLKRSPHTRDDQDTSATHPQAVTTHTGRPRHIGHTSSAHRTWVRPVKPLPADSSADRRSSRGRCAESLAGLPEKSRRIDIRGPL